MKEPEDDLNIIKHPDKGNGLRLVHSEKRESLLPAPKLLTLIEEMKGKQKRVRLTGDDGAQAA
ncbi:MAG TPA: hypothetical protein VIQ24_11760 [Pyrinomonadaceae bacterium]